MRTSTLAPVPLPASPQPTDRELRGRQLAQSGSVWRFDGRLFVVVGSTGTRYLVRFDGRRYVCDCQDFSRWGARPLFMCKHGHGVRFATAHGLIANAGQEETL